MFMTKTLLRLAGAASVVAAAALWVGIGAPSARAETITTTDRVTLDPGTVIPVILNTELTSNGSISGDTFTATVDTSTDAYNNIMQGATVGGFVREATSKQGNNPGTLDLAFTSLRLANGQSYDITGSPTSLDSKNLELASNGLLRAKNTNPDQRLKYAGIGAGAIALIRVIGGKNIRIEDLLLGGLLGYGVGSILKTPDQVHDVDLKPGTKMGVLLNSPVRYFHRSSVTTNVTNETTTVSNHPTKFYWFHGQQWGKDLVTGERFIVTGSMRPMPVYHRAHRKYYWFQGHRFFKDLDTGERVQIS